jgi:hypothetical protein
VTPKKLDPFQVAGYFCGLPGRPRGPKWFVKNIPLLPEGKSKQERDLNLLIAPIQVLKVFGYSKELMEKNKVVHQAADMVQELPMRSKRREQFKLPLDELSEYIQHLLEISRKAEKFLLERGWKFDPEKGTLRQARCSNRPKDFFAEVAWAIYAARYSNVGNTRSVRRKISRELTDYFFKPGTPELSVGAGALSTSQFITENGGRNRTYVKGSRFLV